jgi:hypothetical protein
MIKLDDPATQCFYVEGDLNIIDLVDKNGQPLWGESLEDTLKRYPAAKIMSLNEANEKIDELAKKKYLEADPIEITAERFDKMLNILPPAHWILGDYSSSFQVTERIFGSYTTAFVHLTVNGVKRYFELPVVMGTPHDQITERIVNSLNGGKNA